MLGWMMVAVLVAAVLRQMLGCHWQRGRAVLTRRSRLLSELLDPKRTLTETWIRQVFS
jgi:hypothetical protein